MKITVGLRDSTLSLKQFEELRALLNSNCQLKPLPIKTVGDYQPNVSLRSLGKTNFFTKEIDEMLLAKRCRIGLHAAKDLPDPMTKGLELVALTSGLTPLDSLIFRKNESLQMIQTGGKVGSSSLRRDAAVKLMRQDLTYVDIRGPIEKRIGQLYSGRIEALVVAEAALIRLKLTHLNRIPLSGSTAPLQGKLAVVARKGDLEMAKFFRPIDSRL